MNHISILVLSGAALLALAYGEVWVRLDVSLLRSGIKTGSTAILAAVALIWGMPWLAFALALGAVGDWFLSRDPDTGFLPGLIAFALGHLLYLALLWPMVGAIHPVSAGVFVLILTGVMVRLWPVLGALRGPVAVYAAISAGLGVCALSLPEGHGILRFGVLAFILSDVILSEDLFRLPEGDPRKPIYARILWGLYWGGQAMILIGMAAAFEV
jgi:uncharacterized membrane protein YhhN